MKTFKRRQIKEVENARAKLLEQIEMFEAGAKYIAENYLIIEQSNFIFPNTPRNQFSFKWIEEVKSAIDNIDLKDNKIGERKVTSTFGIELTMALLEYVDEIYKPIREQFKSCAKKSTPLAKIIAEYHRELTYILIV